MFALLLSLTCDLKVRTATYASFLVALEAVAMKNLVKLGQRSFLKFRQFVHPVSNSNLKELHFVLATWLSGLDCSDHTPHTAAEGPMQR